jgi:putative PIN family toxin of toxin-antitoxin system
VRRAVLDTNVVVSGFMRPQSPPGQLLVLLTAGDVFESVLSSSLLFELQRAVQYDKVRSRIPMSDSELNLRIAMLDTLSIPVEPGSDVVGAAPDPDDDKVLAAAREGRADHVVTGDSALLQLGEFEGILIVTPRAFLDLVST